MSLPPAELPSPFDAVQKAVLRRARILAGFSIAACALMPVGVVFALGKAALGQAPTDNQVSANRAGIAVFVAAAIVGVSLRMQTYKANWQGDVVTPAGYAKAMHRYVGAVVVGLLATSCISVAVGHPSAAIDLPVFAIALLVFGFPNGKPMLPQPPDLGSRK